ncbi:MAG: proline racemase family protein [Vicinamibacterales bacterium]
MKTIDAHAAGEPLRLIVDGFPSPRGRTMLAKREWVRTHADHLRRALMLEPRGHADMYGAILTEPVAPGSHAGVLFMHNEGYSTMCGHGVIAVTTMAVERGLIMAPPGASPAEGRSAQNADVTIVYDAPAGTIRARAKMRAGKEPAAGEAGRAGEDGHTGGAAEAARALKRRVESVSFLNVPSFVLHGGMMVKLASRTIRADVAFGGAFYAIVDSEAVGLPIDAAHLPELRRVGMEIKHAIEAAQTIVHPLDAGLVGIYGTIFTGPPNDEASDLRNVTIFADAEVDRSPCGTGTAAVMAVVDAMGLLGAGRPFVHESLIGTRFTGRVASRTQVGECQAIVTEIEGSAWITGEHTFLVDDTDPLKDGFRI